MFNISIASSPINILKCTCSRRRGGRRHDTQAMRINASSRIAMHISNFSPLALRLLIVNEPVNNLVHNVLQYRCPVRGWTVFNVIGKHIVHLINRFSAFSCSSMLRLWNAACCIAHKVNTLLGRQHIMLSYIILHNLIYKNDRYYMSVYGINLGS